MSNQNLFIDAIGKHLEFNRQEAEQFMEIPRNREVVQKIGELRNTHFIFKIIEAKGCGCRHTKGQEITVRGDGVILPDEGYDGACVYLVQAVVPVVYGAQEFIYAGIDPRNLKFRQVGCFDVGLACGGIGHVVVELDIRKKAV